MQQHEETSLLGDAMRSLTRLSSRRPRASLCLVFLSAGMAAALTVNGMQFKTDRADLIDPSAPFHQRWLSYTESFGDAAEFVVVVEAPAPVTIKRLLDELGARLAREPGLFKNILYKVEPGSLRQKGLQYLAPQQLEAGLARLDEFSPVIRGEWDLIRLDSLVSRLRAQLERPADPTNGDEQVRLRPLLEHAETLATSLADSLTDRDEFHNPWPELVAVDPQMKDESRQVTYLLNNAGTIGFLKVLPAENQSGFSGQSASLDRLREIIAEVSARNTEARIGVTGIPVLESDEMRRSQADMLRASLISFAGVGILLVIGFRGMRHPLLAMVMLAVGMAWSFGFTTIAIGHLNILSVSFAVILIGLGIDFGIHYLARYLELRHEGQMLRPALLETSGTVGTGIITAAITTACAFFSATLTQFLGVAELGVIAGGGILLCALATFVVLPALIALADQNVEPGRLPTPFQADLLRASTARHPLLALGFSALLIGGIGCGALRWHEGRIVSRVGYDYNLLNLQAESLESVEVQKRVLSQSGDSLLFAVSVAESPEEARRLKSRFEALPTVQRVEELASRLPAAPSAETQLLVQGVRAQLSRLPDRPPEFTPLNPATVGGEMEKLHLQLRKYPESVAVEATRAIDRFLDRFETLPLSEQVQFLAEFQARLAGALLAQFQGLADAADAEPVTLADLPSELTSRFVSPEGKWLVQVYPREQVWDLEPLERFVEEVRSVDADATGTPLQNYEASRQIVDSYESAALYALGVICFVLLVDLLNREQKLLTLLPPLAIMAVVAMTMETRRSELEPAFLVGTYLAMVAAIAAVVDFRNLRDTLLALFPPIGGGVMMLGVLGLLGVDFNPANLIALPLVLGIGVDDGVHVVHDFRLQRRNYRISSSTMNAIILTSLTSMIGFGSMMVAAHRGLYSVGLVLVIGVGSCLFISLVPLPALLTLIDRGRRDVAFPSQTDPAKAEVLTTA